MHVEANLLIRSGSRGHHSISPLLAARLLALSSEQAVLCPEATSVLLNAPADEDPDDGQPII